MLLSSCGLTPGRRVEPTAGSLAGVNAVGDPALVLHGEGHALALGAVAQRRVVNLDFPGHRGPIIPPPRPRCQVWEGDPYTTPAARSLSILALGMRRRPLRISSVCWPRRGAGAWAAPGVSQRRIGTPMAVTAPALGCTSRTNMPRAPRCSLSQTSATVLMRPAGTPASSRRLSHSG